MSTKATLSKTRSVLTENGDPDLGVRWYIQVDEETEVIRRELYLDIATYQDLGEPETITVTIEPGDLLN